MLVNNINEFPINQMFKIIKRGYANIVIDGEYEVKKTGTEIDVPVDTD